MELNMSFANTSVAPTPLEEKCDHSNFDTSWVPPYIYIISALGILFNLLVLLVFLLHKKNCTATEIYLSSMAAADILLMVIIPLWGVSAAKYSEWPFGGFWCKTASVLVIMNYDCSIYFLVLVSIDRFVALVFPLTPCRLRRRKYAKLNCVLVWFFGFLLSMPHLLYKDAILADESINGTGEYVCTWVGTLDVYLAHEMIQTVLVFIIPLLIISFCTVKIVIALKGRPLQKDSTQQTERKATILVLTVLLAFFVCWFPFNVTRIVELMVRYEVIKSTCALGQNLNTCRLVFVYLGYFNSDLNPVLYVIVGKNFRKKMWEVVSEHSSMGRSITQMTTSTSHLSTQRIQVNAKALK